LPPVVSRSQFARNSSPTTGTQKVYNSAVNSPVSAKPAADDHHDDHPQHRHVTYAAEATGLLLMAAVLLLLVIIHYWRYIPWSAR